MFYTVPHNRLPQRLRECGICGTVLKWFGSFLEDRKQEVWSPPRSAFIPPLNIGVPQGSVLSPVLFNLYMTPFASLVERFGASVISYADNTQLLFTCKKGGEFNGEQINKCLREVFAWFRLNQLKCNSEKPEIIFFGTPSLDIWKHWWPTDMSPPLAAVNTVKNLGVKTDSALSMKNQVQSVTGTCFGLLKMLRKFLPLLPVPHRNIVVQALVTSRLDYVNVLYLGLPEYLLGRLQVAQNAAARAIFMLGPRDRISPHLKNLHWLPVRHRVHFKALVLAFKALHGSGTHYIQKRVAHYIPGRSLRSTHQHRLVVPFFARSRCGGRSFQVQVAQIWNRMLFSLRETMDLLTFRKQLKTWLFQQIS